MDNFTDMLDEYLEASNQRKEARERYNGYEFSYHYRREIDREEQARTALNEAFARITAPKE